VSILLGKKPEDTGWRFVGGHANPKIVSFEADARKEVFEETGLDVSDLQYVGSTLIDSWRWRTEKAEGMKTLLFVAWSMTLGGKAADDLAECRWLDLSILTEVDIETEHRPLFRMLSKHPDHEEWGIPTVTEDRNGSRS